MEVFNSPIFIVGCDRSGTTLLRLMLNQHSRIAIPDESDFVSYIIDRKDKYGDLREDRNLEKLCNDLFSVERYRIWQLDDRIVRKRIMESNRSLNELLRTPYELHLEQKGKKRWGDKTPHYALYVLPIHEIFSDAKFIHVIRDGRDVAVSLKNVRWYSNNIINISHHWKKMVEVGCASKKVLANQYMEIKYEALVSYPEAIVKRVCEFIGENYESQMIEYYESAQNNFAEMYMGDHELLKKKPTTQRIGVWRTHLSRSQVRIFEIIAGKTLESAGYERVRTIGYNRVTIKIVYAFCFLILLTLKFKEFMRRTIRRYVLFRT